jgi:hypothetical protein
MRNPGGREAVYRNALAGGPDVNLMEAVMKRNWQLIVCGGALVGLITATLTLAHHSFAAEFDSTKPVTLK